MNIINLEQPKGVVVQFGGQTAINLADKLAETRRSNLRNIIRRFKSS